MSGFPIKSILEKVCQQVWQETNLEVARKTVIDFINDRKIKEEDKKRMVLTVNEITSKAKLDRYIANSLLQFEGMSVVKTFSKKEKEKEPNA
jgi:hypothetical protein